jgi:hypothetical protein
MVGGVCGVGHLAKRVNLEAIEKPGGAEGIRTDGHRGLQPALPPSFSRCASAPSSWSVTPGDRSANKGFPPGPLQMSKVSSVSICYAIIAPDPRAKTPAFGAN